MSNDGADEWKLGVIADIGQINPSVMLSGLTEDLPVSFLTMSDVSENGRVISQQIRKLREVKSGFTRFEERDVLFAKITPCMENGKGAMAIGLTNKIGFGSTEFHVIRENSFGNAEYIYQVLQSTEFRQQATSYFSGSAGQQRVSKDIFFQHPVHVPPLGEQKKIARILTTIDNLIEKTEALIAKYKSIKQGMMNDLFTRGVDQNGRLRPPYEQAPQLYKDSELGKIPKDWEVQKLRDITVRNHQGINTAADTIKYQKSGNKILQAKHITSCTIEDEDARYVSELDFDFYRERFCPKRGNILFTNIGTIGKSLVVEADSDFLVAWNIFLIELDQNQSPYFVNHFLTFLDENGFYDGFAAGNATRFINKVQIAGFAIPIPTQLEQDAITDVLSKSERRLEQAKAIVQKYQSLKSGLMQDLLTGKVRVNVDELEEELTSV